MLLPHHAKSQQKQRNQLLQAQTMHYHASTPQAPASHKCWALAVAAQSTAQPHSPSKLPVHVDVSLSVPRVDHDADLGHDVDDQPYHVGFLETASGS
jgi:hypothetical protein